MSKFIKDKNLYCPKCDNFALWIGVTDSSYAKYYCPNCYYQWDLDKIYTRNLIKE